MSRIDSGGPRVATRGLAVAACAGLLLGLGGVSGPVAAPPSIAASTPAFDAPPSVPASTPSGGAAPSSIVVGAENWPQWRGPELNGISRETDLPVRWTTEENVAWTAEMPAWSGSTPIVWEDRIFLNVAESEERLGLWCLDRRDGTILWKRDLGGGNRRQRKQNMSSPSPVTDGEHVWVMTGTGILAGFDLAGEPIWSRNIQEDYWRFGLNWGYASSPLLHGGSLYVQVLHGMKTDDPSYVLRIDKLTGETIWQIERPTDAIRESPDSYTTPALLRYGDTTEIVITGGDVVTGHDPASGEELWRVDGLNPENIPWYRIVASPVVHGDLIIAPTREEPMLALRADPDRAGVAPEVIWSFDQGPDVPTPVTDGSHVYVVNDKGIVFCLDADTGETIYGPQRIAPGTYSASPVLADGRIYATNEDGVTTVYTAGPSFEVLAENDLADYTLSSPAVSDGQIFLRTAGALWAVGERVDGGR